MLPGVRAEHFFLAFLQPPNFAISLVNRDDGRLVLRRCPFPFARQGCWLCQVDGEIGGEQTKQRAAVHLVRGAVKIGDPVVIIDGGRGRTVHQSVAYGASSLNFCFGGVRPVSVGES